MTFTGNGWRFFFPPTRLEHNPEERWHLQRLAWRDSFGPPFSVMKKLKMYVWGKSKKEGWWLTCHEIHGTKKKTRDALQKRKSMEMLPNFSNMDSKNFPTYPWNIPQTLQRTTKAMTTPPSSQTWMAGKSQAMRISVCLEKPFLISCMASPLSSSNWLVFLCHLSFGGCISSMTISFHQQINGTLPTKTPELRSSY